VTDTYAAAIAASDAMEAAAAAYDEPDDDRDLLAAYLEAKRAAGVASATAEHGPIGGEMVDVGQQLAAARAEVERLTQRAAELTAAADASPRRIPQTVIAQYLGVDRMTVRKWLGLR
jgi:hypothetical protein